VLHARTSHSLWFDEGVQIMTLLIMQFSVASCHLSFLGSNILLSILFSNTLNVYFSRNLWSSSYQVDLLFPFHKRERDPECWDLVTKARGNWATGYIITAVKMK
jgi:hypothetical protein